MHKRGKKIEQWSHISKKITKFVTKIKKETRTLKYATVNQVEYLGSNDVNRVSPKGFLKRVKKGEAKNNQLNIFVLNRFQPFFTKGKILSIYENY